MLRRLDLRGLGPADAQARLPRPNAPGDEPVAVVREILAEVRDRGDDALRDLTERLDGVRPSQLSVPRDEWDAALARIPAETRAALEAAAASIRAFQEAERAPDVHYEAGGIATRTLRRPVDRAGCYVPGGRARAEPVGIRSRKPSNTGPTHHQHHKAGPAISAYARG